ncbi:MAG: tetratricopeptide repeat protein [Pseudomonadota bacterium]
MNDPRHNPAESIPYDEEIIHRAEHLCDLGLYLQVQPMLEALTRHPQIKAQILATRALGHLGARRAADARIIRLWHQHRENASAISAFVRQQAYRHGPQRAWSLLNRLSLHDDASAASRAEWHSLRAYVFSMLRDFERAQESYEMARTLAPDDPWTLVEWSHACEMRDRYDEGIAAAQEALRLQDGYRSAIQALAHLQILVGEEAQALALLERAHAECESGYLAAQLLDLQVEQGEYAAAWDTLERCVELLPLADKEWLPWLRSRRIEIALRLGRLEEARRYASESQAPAHRQLVQRLDDGVTPHRVQLPVGFVRQHYLTCAPATLATLSRYWGLAAEHLEIAERICYDGTPNHSERHWAETQGFVTREFTVDWKTACALIDAGIPFTLVTVYTGGAHLQAVIGYDALRGTLLIRDPFKRIHGEFAAEDLFASHRSSGPRGMLIVPATEAYRLDGIELPEAKLWDGYHRVMAALDRHDRDTAIAVARHLSEEHADHRLTIGARRAIAIYDGDENTALAATEQLLALFPSDVNLQLSKAASLSVLRNRAQQVEWLAGIANTANADPVAMIRHAQLLADDGRLTQEALHLLDRALRKMPSDAGAWQTRASLLWQIGLRKQAVDHYRIAACLQETNEDYAASYFRAMHFVGRTQEGLDFLRHRAQRLGHRSSSPVMTLFQQLETLEHTEEAFVLLDEFLARRPDDTALLIFAADTHLRFRRLDRAREYLERCKRTAKRARWLHSRAQLARECGDTAEALNMAKEATTLEPFNLAHHRLVASILAQTDGRRTAIGYLRETAQRFPHHCGLQELLIDWLSDELPQDSENIIRHLVEISPSNAWAQRELAMNLARQQRFDEAWAVMQRAREMAPNQSATHSTMGFLRIQEGRLAEARQHLRDALALSIDDNYALNTLIGLGHTLAERQEALSFIRAELVRQVTLGDSLLTFQNAAQTTLDPRELLAVLREALAERPDLWQAWVAVASQLIDMNDLDASLTLIDEAIDRFPMLPRLYLEQGRAYALKGQRDAARESLKVALQITPQWTRAVRMYVDTVLDDGRDFERALAVLDNALHRSPEDAALHALKALVLLRMAQPAAAVTEIQDSLRLDPQPTWVWNMLLRIADDTGDADLMDRVVTDITRHRPGDASAWIKASEFGSDPSAALEAADRALELEPRSKAAYENRLALLLRLGRFDEIEAALATTPWADAAPASVRVFGARVLHARGAHRKAIDALRSLLREDPNSFALWQELADWSDAADDTVAYREAAENMLRLAPNVSTAHGYLAHALLKAGEKARAKAHFQRAVELDPAYAFASLNLTDLYLDERDIASAEAVLATLVGHVRNASVIARQVQLAILKKEPEVALTFAHQVFEAPGDTQSACQMVIEAFLRAAWGNRLEKAVLAWFNEGRCSYAAVRFWIERQGSGWLPDAFYRAIKRALRQDPAHSLKRALLDYIGEKRDLKLLRRFIRRYRTELIEDAESWAMVSYAFLSCDQYLEVARWMHDWRERPATPAWALDNLAVALRSLRRHDAARAVTLRSLELAPNNLDAKTWLAVDAARADDADELARLLGSIPRQGVREYYQNILTVLQSYLDAARAGDSRKALPGFASLSQKRRSPGVLRDLMRALSWQLVRKYTPPLWRPLRWLQLSLA